MERKSAAVLLLLLAASQAVDLRADAAKVLNRQLSEAYKGKSLTLRKFYCGDALRFNAEGGLPHGSQPGPWTLCGMVRVEYIKASGDGLKIKGNRVLVMYKDDGKQTLYLRGPGIEIQMALDKGLTSFDDLQPQLAKVFLAKNERLGDVVPDYWKVFLGGRPEVPTQGPPDKTKSVAVTVGPLTVTTVPRVEPAETKPAAPAPVVTPPKPIHKPEPHYTEAARQVRLEGTLVLWFEIDASGDANVVLLIKPLGLGLDENAVEAVKTWKFKPATRNGIPVRVRAMAEITFHLK